MYKKLVRHGNSNALVLDKPILELLSISEETLLRITTDGFSLTITPVGLSEDSELTGNHNQIPKNCAVLENYCKDSIIESNKVILGKRTRRAVTDSLFMPARKEN